MIKAIKEWAGPVGFYTGIWIFVVVAVTWITATFWTGVKHEVIEDARSGTRVMVVHNKTGFHAVVLPANP